MKAKCVVLLVFMAVVPVAAAQSKKEEPGLRIKEAGIFEGYNLFSPLDAATTYLIDNDGRVINTWDSDFRPGNHAYLLDNGNILRNAGFGLGGNGKFHGGGAGYRVEEITWEGEKVWEFIYASDEHLMHHDIEPMPNGNILILAWELKNEEECIQAGRDPEVLKDDELWPEHILEIKPNRPHGAQVVWEWHLWDHLVQDLDETKDNYGDPAAHPELMDANPPGLWMDRISEEEMEKLQALGYLGDDVEPKKKRGVRGGADWCHTNAIAYNAELDHIALSILGNNEIWIIDHSTSTDEARGHTGGRSGKGGDLLYRWGNPFAYRAGAEEDQTLFAQHDVHWIPKGKPGAGNLLIFNNGRGRSDGTYSSVIEIVPPLNDDGTYHLELGKSYGPQGPVWEYTAPNKKDFNSFYISGSERQPNGNTLICEGAAGVFFEVTPDMKTVWRYKNPAFYVPPPVPEGEKKKKGRRPNNNVYRVYRYAPDHPAFAGKDMTPGPLLTKYLKEHPAKKPLQLEEFLEREKSG